MALQRAARWSIGPKILLGTFAVGSAVTTIASSQLDVFCQDDTVIKDSSHGDNLSQLEGLLSNAVSSGISAVSIIKERVLNTGIVRFGRAAAVVRI